MNNQSIDIAIITALPEEYHAVKKYLTVTNSYQPQIEEPNLFAWEIGEIKNEKHNLPYSIVLANTGKPGTSHGALTCYITVKKFRPTYTFFVGVAGGLPKDKQKLNDVAISDTIWGYEYGKIKSVFEPRSNLTYQADHSLLTNSNVFHGGDKWKKIINEYSKNNSDRHDFTVRSGLILSGDKVIDNPDSRFFSVVKDKCPNALAVEMEGVGAAIAIHLLLSDGLISRFLMIRGISDIPKKTRGDKQTIERDKNKERASDNAALFVTSFIKNFLPSPPMISERKIVRVSNKSWHDKTDDLLYTLHIRNTKAIQSLLSLKNRDGGIPSTRPQSNSGIWTTASVLEAIASSNDSPLSTIIDCRDFSNFLLINQKKSSWPAVRVSRDSRGNTISTAHCISALSAIRHFYPQSDKITQKIDSAISDSITWLKNNINSDRGWSVEPDIRKNEVGSRISATYYAVKALLDSKAINIDDVLKGATEFVLSKRLPSGGWSNADDTEGKYGENASNTARAVMTLIYTGQWNRNKSELKKSVDILSNISKNDSWEIDSETIPSTNPAGQTIYHNNAPCDVLNLLVMIETDRTRLLKPIYYLLNNLNELGLLPLIDPIKKKPRIPAITWPTAEFIYTISKVSQYLNR